LKDKQTTGNTWVAQENYNEMATVFFTTQEDAIQSLFHNEFDYSIGTLVIFFVVCFLLACITYGTSVPSGLFVPSLLCGCALGRLFGQIMDNIFPDMNIDPGTFALLGAAAMLAGIVRMTM